VFFFLNLIKFSTFWKNSKSFLYHEIEGENMRSKP